MAGSRKSKGIYTEFWCIRCGKKGIPIMRERNKLRGMGHRKKLYCVHCKAEVNHVETRNPEEAQKFREDFEAGLYREEAEESITYTKEQRRRREHGGEENA